MATPTNRATLITYCKQRLGHPVIELNLNDDQISDRIDDALQYYRDYHNDATEHLYLKHQVTATDISNQYIAIDDSIIGVVNVYPVTDDANYGTVNMFDMRYQMRLNDLFDFNDVSILHYTMVTQHLDLIQDYFEGKAPFDYARHMDKLKLYIDWTNDINADEYIVIECYKAIDTANVYNDMWLKRYATALIKKQWGENLSKFDGITLPGGITYNGGRILEDANAEIEKLETEIELNHGGLLTMLTG